MKSGCLIALLSFCLVAYTGIVKSQDVHFSQYYASPQLVNPALTGVFNGGFRFAAQYRNQWRSVTPNTFSTIAFSADMSLLKRSLGKDYVGIGINLFQDRAGDGNLGLTYAGFSMAYSKALSRNTKQYLSFGAQFGFTQRKIDFEYLVFNSQYDGNTINGFSTSREPLSKNRYFNWDNQIGLLWYMSPTDEINVFAGMSIAHLNRPNQSFYTNGDQPLFIKYTLHAGMELQTTEQFHILPKLLVLKQGPSQEINIGATTRLVPNPHNHGFVNSFYGGVMYRFSNFTSHDAIIFLAGGEYRRINFGLTFDMNVSRLVEASYSVGGPELSITYILPSGKLGGSNNTRYCPDGINF
ncbi:MAG: PorP/SprF family type IX secretion system membrane protein [Chitinophagales bacterium]|nr:PorP/SprF family type IX secretion system membrane protein [Chitinophagales bacterium]